MNNLNFNQALIAPMDEYIIRNWVNAADTNLMKKHVLARGAYFILFPASLIVCAIDTIIGLGTGLSAVLAFGTDPLLNGVAIKYIRSSSKLLVEPYKFLLLTLNPKADFGSREGFLVTTALVNLKNATASLRESDSWINHHIIFRLTRIALAVICLITRAADSMISIPLVAASLLTCGQFTTINNLAFKALNFCGVISDFFILTVTFINPWPTS